MDREKVIKGLEELQTWLKHLQSVGYHGDIPEYRERELTVSDALVLLKEQDTVDHALGVLRAHGWKDDSEVTGDG